jgi:hypothetical protein
LNGKFKNYGVKMNIIAILISLGTFGLFFGLFTVFILIMFWFYGLPSILHWFVKSNGEQANAVVLEVQDAGWGWYSGSRYSRTLIFQPVRVKLEVHPNHGIPYIATDRFNAKHGIYREKLKPGVEMQVVIARFRPQWVASLPETIVEPPALKGHSQRLQTPADKSDDARVRLEKLKQLLSSGQITEQEYNQKKMEILEKM